MQVTMTNTSNKIRDFFKMESASGILLVIMAIIAMLLANSSLATWYNSLLEIEAQVRIGSLNLEKPLLLWINDGLMALFFLLVGLEVKRELREGQLTNLSQITLPGVAAIGGMLIPALIYVALNWNDPVALNGWAIPAATDIAFALGILSLFGKRVPASLKLFLLTIAIIDDLGAIAIIAIFYTTDLSLLAVALAFLSLIVLFIFNRSGITNLSVYALVGVLLWVFVLKSGVHATLAGVALAFAIPLRAANGRSPLHDLEHSLQPWVAFAILPIFALANAGISLGTISFSTLFTPVPLGIIIGLFIGKQLGVFGFSWLTIKLGWAALPTDTNWWHIYGVSLLCGVGFTMSLFITSLAFEHAGPQYVVADRLGILVGSLLSAITGYIAINFASKR